MMQNMSLLYGPKMKGSINIWLQKRVVHCT